jgi:fido (protein-threonine AMPylation protein)
VADPYVYLGTNVLRNLAGLKDAGLLAEREAQTSTLRLAQLAERRLAGSYDLRHLQGFHRFIFQDIYPWADARSEHSCVSSPRMQVIALHGNDWSKRHSFTPHSGASRGTTSRCGT